MRIGLDLDGVVYHFQKTYCYMMNSMRGYNLDHTKWTQWHWPTQEAGVTKEDSKWMWSEGVKLGLFRYGHLYKGAIEGIRSLASLGDIVVVTHRPKSAIQDTLDWLAYIRMPFSEIHMLYNSEPKSSVQPHCHMYIDDKAENIADVINKTRGYGVLWERPWNLNNRKISPERYSSISEWSGAIDIAKRIHG